MHTVAAAKVYGGYLGGGGERENKLVRVQSSRQPISGGVAARIRINGEIARCR